MAAHIDWDVMPGAVAQAGPAGYRISRMGHAVELALTNPYALLTQCFALCPAANSAYPDPAYASALFTRAIVRPTAGSDTAMVEAIYETPGFGGGGQYGGYGIYLVQDTTILTNETTQIDDQGDLIVVDYTDPTTGIKLPPRVPNMSCDRSIRQLLVQGIVQNRPAESVREKVRYVNDQSWQGRDSGYWKCSYFQALAQRFQYGYGVEARFTTRDNRSWLQLDVYRRFGQVVSGLDVAAIKAKMTGAYFYGQFKGNGYTVVGNHPTADFLSTFGF